jgi:hypothetical protein
MLLASTKQGRKADKAGELGQWICPLYLPIFLEWLLTKLTFTGLALWTVNQSILVRCLFN